MWQAPANEEAHRWPKAGIRGWWNFCRRKSHQLGTGVSAAIDRWQRRSVKLPVIDSGFAFRLQLGVVSFLSLGRDLIG